MARAKPAKKADRSELRVAMDDAYELRALFLGAQVNLERAQDKGSKDRARLKSQYDSDIAEIDATETAARTKVEEAKDELSGHQRMMQDEFGAAVNLLEVRQGGSTRL